MDANTVLDQLAKRVASINEKQNVQYAQSTFNPGREIFVQVFDLSTARGINNPLEIPGPLRSLRVRDGSDGNAYVYFTFDSKGSDASGTDSAKLKKSEVWNSDAPLAKGFFWWPAQSGKTLTIEFFRRGSITPGVFTTQVSQVFGSVEATEAVATVASAAALLLAADVDRKRAYIQNQGTDDIYLGSSTVTGGAGARPGQKVMPGQTFIFDNVAALYAITDGATNANVAMQVFK